MTTPRRYAVVQILPQFNFVVRDRDRGLAVQSYVQQGRDQSWMGEITADTMVVWCDNRRDAEITLDYVQRTNRRNSYALCKVEEVTYVPETPSVRAEFTDQGLMPV